MNVAGYKNVALKKAGLRRDPAAENAVKARAVRHSLALNGVLMLNVMGPSGAGVTSLIQRTAQGLPELRVGVVEGNVAGNRDIPRVLAAGAQAAVQIATGPGGQLDAATLELALTRLDLAELDILIIENLGDLIRASDYGLGEHMRVSVLSACGSDDVAVKFPSALATCDAVVLSKVDLLGQTNFDLETYRSLLHKLNDSAHTFELSCRTGAGLEPWLSYIKRHAAEAQADAR